MTQTSVYGGNYVIRPELQMAHLGKTMREFAEFYWIGLCLCFLIVPPIMLLIKYINMIQAMNELNRTMPNYGLQSAYQKFVTAMILVILSGVFGIFLHPIFGILIGISAFVCQILGTTSLENWAFQLHQQKPNQFTSLFVSGITTFKNSTILMILGIGFFMLPGGIQRAGDALLLEYGDEAPLPYPMQYIATSAQVPNNPNSPSFRTTRISVVQNNQCPKCGDIVPNEAKFCANCGYRL